MSSKLTTLPKPAPPSDAEILATIERAIEAESEWGEVTKVCFARYKHAGELLQAKKDSLEHGEWMKWLISNAPKCYRKKADPERKNWIRTAERWKRIAFILNNAHPSVIESAQTVAQLFRLAQMLPEGGGAGGTEPRPLEPLQIVSKVQRLFGSLPSREEVVDWPEDAQEQLREEIEKNMEREKGLLEALGN